MSAPIAFQETGRGRVEVDVRYTLHENGSLIGFKIGKYDPRLPLTIDPLLQSTYLSYGGQGSVTSMAVDPTTGDLIAAGFVSIGIPGAAGGFQSIEHDSMGYIARIDSTLRRVIQATYFGQTYLTMVARVAVHPITGEIYVAGETQFAGFPGGGGGANPVLGGSRDDGFVARFSPDLRQLRQTTFAGQDLQYVLVRDMAINATTGDIYVVGNSSTSSVVLRFNRDLTTQIGRRYIQGNSFTYGTSIAINQNTGDVYAAAYTSSTVMPGMAGGAEPSVDGTEPVSNVTRMSADLSQVIQSTFVTEITPGPLPHTGNRYMPLIALNPASGEIYVAGWCWNKNVATNGGAFPNFLGGDDDVMVTRLSPDLQQKRGSTYFGGSGFEELGAITFSQDGAHVYITGFTFSPDLRRHLGRCVSHVVKWRRLRRTLLSVTRDARAIDLFPRRSATRTDTRCSCIRRRGKSIWAVHQSKEFRGSKADFSLTTTVRILSSVAHSSHASMLLLSGGIDTVADAFSFADQSGVAAGSVVISAPIRVEGITVPVTVTVTNGEFSIDGDLYSIGVARKSFAVNPFVYGTPARWRPAGRPARCSTSARSATTSCRRRLRARIRLRLRFRSRRAIRSR